MEALLPLIGNAAAGLIASAVATAFVTPVLRQARRAYLRGRHTGASPITPDVIRVPRRRRVRLVRLPARPTLAGVGR